MPEQTFDAIVVGSGISGGWAAKELTEKGLKTLVLERGKNIEHVKDYVNANKEAWDYPYRGTRTVQMEEDYPVLKRDYPLNEKNLDWWVKDSEYRRARAGPARGRPRRAQGRARLGHGRRRPGFRGREGLSRPGRAVRSAR
ncbi:MAG: NAD(P)-binding protein, partial [Haliscomenobacter sp.]